MTGAPSRRKGANAEALVARWLRNNGYPDARRYLAGDGRQPGDIDGVPGLVAEVKNQRRYDIPAWLRQTQDEADGRGEPVLIVKPTGITDVGQWWAIQTVEGFFDLYREVNG